jgi:biotin-dependent carboxylase-like uncharacterized protein
VLEIVAVGAGAFVQDLGRPGYAHLGVPRSGAFDRPALRLANRLVGNPEDAAVIEATLGLTLRVEQAATLACTGAACAGLDWGTAITLAAGTLVRLAPPATGLRSYVAVRGGLAVEPVLASRSTDVLSGLGPRPLRPGDRLPIGPQPQRRVPDSTVPAPRTHHPAAPLLRLSLGPRSDWFDYESLVRLSGSVWLVRPDSDRVGLRLAGPPLTRSWTGELPSEPVRPGALQVPADGRPILFGPDAPVTGGYPVIGVVDAAGLTAAAQLRPGDPVRFQVET